ITDPVGLGLIASYARPGGNVTGTSRVVGSLGPKLLDLLRQLVPRLARVAVVFDLSGPPFENDWQAIQATAQSLGIEAQEVGVGIASADDLEGALTAALSGRPQALIVYVGSGMIIPGTNRSSLSAITSLAIQHALPATSINTTTRPAGGLLYYG